MKPSVDETPVPSANVDQNAEAANDRWLEFFSVLIHDIESPMASVKYLLKLLDEDRLDLQKPAHKTLVTSSRIAVDRVESIIYYILAVSRAGRIGLPVKLQTVYPEATMKEAINLAEGSQVELWFEQRLGQLATQQNEISR